MSELDFFQTISKPSIAEFKERGSKFIGHAFPIETKESFKMIFQQLKKEHPKAVHHCFAYRLGSDGNQFRVSDDGEPGGTAGRPILGQIDSKQLTNIAVIIVRYFGGTLLGVPGLIQAYKSSASMALQLTPIVQKSIEINFELHFDYTIMNDVMNIIKQTGCSVVGQDTQLFCLLIVGIPKAKLDEVLYRLSLFHKLEVKKIEISH